MTTSFQTRCECARARATALGLGTRQLAGFLGISRQTVSLLFKHQRGSEAVLCLVEHGIPMLAAEQSVTGLVQIKKQFEGSPEFQDAFNEASWAVYARLTTPLLSA